jgi:hypothetical protein
MHTHAHAHASIFTSPPGANFTLQDPEEGEIFQICIFNFSNKNQISFVVVVVDTSVVSSQLFQSRKLENKQILVSKNNLEK